MIAATDPDFLFFFYACQYAGIVPVPLPLSYNLGGHEAYVERLKGMLVSVGASAAVAPPDFIDPLREALRDTGIDLVGTPPEFYGLPAKGGELRPLETDEPCYIQHSSGSTSDPRGVMVTQRSITSNARAIGRHGLGLRQGDRSTSWLPLYHDMGLVGFCVTPALSQVSIDYISTVDFARRPLIWLKMISEHGSTVSFSPTFGYQLCVRRSKNGHRDAFDLSTWRIAGIGGEMIRPDVFEEFAECFADRGFDRRAFLPSYGLAEATLAVSFAPLGQGLRVDVVDRESYEQTGHATPIRSNGNGSSGPARTFAICGRVLPGHAVEIRGPDGNALRERTIGRVFVKGPSVMGGYFKNPEATGTVLTSDGWLDTGDMGYLADEELVVTGRSKDLIIYNGRNIWPQDLEWTVEKLSGVRDGCVAAFSTDDEREGEGIVIVAESRLFEQPTRDELEREIKGCIHRTAGVNCEVVLVPAGTLTFTSSGKLSRAAARAGYLSGSFEAFSRQEPAKEPGDEDQIRERRRAVEATAYQ